MGLFDALSPPTGMIKAAGKDIGKAIPIATQQAVAGQQGQQGTLSAAEQAALQAQQLAGTQGTGYLNQALGLYGPLAQTANQAFGLYNQALSGGPDAAKAFQDFWNSTGAQAELEKGTTGLERMANSRGMLSSGNLTQDEIDYMTNAVRGGYQNWLGDLWNVGQQAPVIAGSQAGLYGGLADIAARQGTSTQSILGEFAPQVGATQADIGQTRAGGTMAAAQNKAQTLANLFNADVSGSQNFLGLLGGLTNPLAYLGGMAMA